jgi:hypothetical protein
MFGYLEACKWFLDGKRGTEAMGWGLKGVHFERWIRGVNQVLIFE